MENSFDFLRSTVVRFDYFGAAGIEHGGTGLHLKRGWIVTNPVESKEMKNMSESECGKKFMNAKITIMDRFNNENSFNLSDVSVFVIFSRSMAAIDSASNIFHCHCSQPQAKFSKGDLAFIYIPSLESDDFNALDSCDKAIFDKFSVPISLHPGFRCVSFHYSWWVEKRSDGLIAGNEFIVDCHKHTFQRNAGNASHGANGCPVFSADLNHLIGIQYGYKGKSVRSDILLDFLIHSETVHSHMNRILKLNDFPTSDAVSNQIEGEYSKLKTDLNSLGYGVYFF